MQIQQTSNVNFGMNAKFYGIRDALKTGLTINDLKEVRVHMARLRPQMSTAKVIFTDALKRGKGSLGIEISCNDAKVNSDEHFKSLGVGHITLVDLMKKMANNIAQNHEPGNLCYVHDGQGGIVFKG